MHLAGRSYGAYLENPRGPKWWRFAAQGSDGLPRSKDHQQLLENELAFQAEHRFPDLPRGPVHADLFRDNTLFEDGRICGVIDFYFAGVDCLLYDLAVCANDWCLANGPCAGREPGARRCSPPTTRCARSRALEREAWPVMLRAAALRFWLSRLYDFHLPRPGMLVHAHDPEHFRRVLESRIAQPPALERLMQARIVEARAGRALARRRLAPVPRRAARLARAGVRLLAHHDARLGGAVHRRRRGVDAGAGVLGRLHGGGARRLAPRAGRARPAVRRLSPPAARASSSSAWSTSSASALLLAATTLADDGALASWMLTGRRPDEEALQSDDFLAGAVPSRRCSTRRC